MLQRTSPQFENSALTEVVAKLLWDLQRQHR